MAMDVGSFLKKMTTIVQHHRESVFITISAPSIDKDYTILSILEGNNYFFFGAFNVYNYRECVPSAASPYSKSN